MNRDDIIRMAKEAEAWSLVDHDGIAALERFAALVAAAEREECANVLMDMAERDNSSNYYLHAALLVRERGAP